MSIGPHSELRSLSNEKGPSRIFSKFVVSIRLESSGQNRSLSQVGVENAQTYDVYIYIYICKNMYHICIY